MPKVSKEKKPKKLRGKLAVQIAGYIQDKNLAEGGSLTETGLADVFGVSRSPVRVALEELRGAKIIESTGPRRGFRVIASAAVLAEIAETRATTDVEETLYARIAEDYMQQKIGEQFSEADINRRYKVGRKVMVRVLQRMASDRVIERNSGYGWRFASLLRSEESLAESFYFRLLIEPQALLAPGFKLDKTWLERSRRDHQLILTTPYSDASMVRFFETNSNFHEKLAEMSGNPFIHQAVQLQNQVRRFVDVGGNYGYEKIREGCEEHLQILDALDRGDNEWASSLMRRHIELASRNKPVD